MWRVLSMLLVINVQEVICPYLVYARLVCSNYCRQLLQGQNLYAFKMSAQLITS